MLYTEPRFAVFFALVWCVHWSLRENRARKLWLLFASYAFYAAWDWRFLGLIAASTALDFAAGRGIAAARAAAARRAWLTASVCGNLGVLGLFKYFDFFARSAASFLRALGLPASDLSLQLVLPVGISFYTFQSLSYTIDVYRGRIRPAAGIADFALFVGFFPQLVAGPIVRATEFLPQLGGARRLADVRVRACLVLFLVGFFKKACIADNVAPAVDLAFGDPSACGIADAWLAAALFAVQIYCDFSGYSDMAVAAGGLLGYRLPQNFRFPYLAQSVSEFWRRWHITLSTWLRDYVYVALGGNRRGLARTAANVLLTFALGGLWHGAALTFLSFGLLFGALVLLEARGLGRLLERWPRPLRSAYLTSALFVALILFRSADMEAARTMLAAFFGRGPAAGAPGLDPLWWVLVAGFALGHVASSRDFPSRALERLPAFAFAAAYGALIALILPWIAVGYRPFVYFQF